MEWKDIVEAQSLMLNDDEQSLSNPDNEFWGYSAEYAEKTFPERKAAKDIMVYGAPFLLVVGTIGNVVSAIVLWRLLRKVLSTCVYVFVMMPVDLVALYIRCGNDWLVHTADVNVRHIAMLSSKSMCKIYPFVEDLALHFTIWMTVAMAVETAIVTMKPKDLMKICTIDRARAVVMLLVVLMVCVSAHCFWTYALIKIERTSYQRLVCVTIRPGHQNTGDHFRRYVWPIMGILVTGLIPYLVIFSCTVLTVTRRLRKRDEVKQLENTWKAYSVDSGVARQCQVAFSWLCVMHLVLYAPQLTFDIVYFCAHPVMMAMTRFSIDLDAKLELASGVSSFLLYVYLSCKFLVIMAVCKRFRQEFLDVIMCRLCRKRRRVTRRTQNDHPVNREPLLNNENSVTPVNHRAACVVRTEYAMTSVWIPRSPC